MRRSRGGRWDACSRRCGGWGLEVEGDRETLPLTLRGTSRLVPIEYEMPVASAQVKARPARRIARRGRAASSKREASRDHTERMLRYFGAEVTTERGDDGLTRISVTGQPELAGRDVSVPGDPSSAAFLTARRCWCRVRR